MTFSQVLPTQSTAYSPSYISAVQWQVLTGSIVPTVAEIENQGDDAVTISSGLSMDLLGDSHTVEAGASVVVSITATSGRDFYVAAQGVTLEGECSITPGIENE
jgi:hypothetical protein